MSVHSHSKEGFSPKVWGPGLWDFLHIVSMNYPVHPTVDDKRNYGSFLMSLRHVLPCRKCREHYSQLMFGPFRLNDRHLASRFALTRYMYALHARVTQDIRKEKPIDTLTPSFPDAVRRYESLRYRANGPKIASFVHFYAE